MFQVKICSRERFASGCSRAAIHISGLDCDADDCNSKYITMLIYWLFISISKNLYEHDNDDIAYN
jgi:hypothetical protein